MDQFAIKPIVPLSLGGFDVSFTNSALFMLASVFIASAFFISATRKRAMVPNAAQSMAEIAYKFVDGIIVENAGERGRVFFPYLFSIFLFVMMGNLLGLVPYGFTFTSHVAAVGALALLGFFIGIITGIRCQGWGFLHTFFPKGTPWVAAPVMIPIEIISYMSRPFSLTVRLVANMMVGHVMLKVVGGFIVMLGVFGVIPMLFAAAILIFEMGIALLQAYIFTVLSTVYLGDALKGH